MWINTGAVTYLQMIMRRASLSLVPEVTRSRYCSVWLITSWFKMGKNQITIFILQVGLSVHLNPTSTSTIFNIALIFTKVPVLKINGAVY